MKSFSRFLIIANESKDIDLKWSKYTLSAMESRGCTAYLHVGVSADSEEQSRQLNDQLDLVDAVIVMGGDGTMLRVAHALQGRTIPVVGVNLGTVGFMTEVVVSEIDSMVERLMAGDYEIEERMMLQGEAAGKTIHALNDIVLARDNALRLIAVEISVNGRHFDTCEADGILVSTPTGSTGYNLSAGGPIVQPSAKLMVMTPISPFSLSKRSVVFGADDKITLKLIAKRKDAPSKGLVSFDGADNVSMQVGDTVDIQTSPYTLSVIKLDTSSVYEILSKKLSN